MSFRQSMTHALRQLTARLYLAPAALAALFFLAAPPTAKAGTCPPCSSSDPNVCAFNCCLFQNCSSPAGPACVASCALGWLAFEIFSDGDTGPAFKSVSGQRDADCHGENKVGVITLPAVDSRQTTKQLEIGLVSISDKKFLTTPGEVASVVVEVAAMQDYKDSEGKPRWRALGLATFDTRAGAWILDWHLSSYNLTEYVVRARAARRDGRVQEARAVALTGTATN